mgnify:CR=1 FL=1
MRFIVLTLFKEMFDAFVNTSIIKRAIERYIVSIDVLDIREFTKDKHKRVDFPPYGGGSGMIMSAQPLGDAIDYAIFSLEKYKKKIKIIYMSPRGKVLNYNISKKLSQNDCNYIIICGHYEGIDERIIGGELACQVLMDSVIRLIPGVISQESLSEESHTNGLLEYPQYTKPYEFKGRKVPDILLSGHHKMIADYRRQESIRITRQHRPDLINNEIIPKKEGN